MLDTACGDDGGLERYKLCVVGDSETGKTCLLNALVKSDFEVMVWFLFLNEPVGNYGRGWGLRETGWVANIFG